MALALLRVLKGVSRKYTMEAERVSTASYRQQCTIDESYRRAIAIQYANNKAIERTGAKPSEGRLQFYNH
ncbi:hypothetical protein B2J93_5260 [Marssonina coronariae]|uniref:Uncharacterized protein n=1 Tax=Diplocarpon coronariae TaxID=2795749 RepID=A0A218YSI7_9HELO|nr:hypothetical protein B2J93_5260 [Marssonina coronariae]